MAHKAISREDPIVQVFYPPISQLKDTPCVEGPCRRIESKKQHDSSPLRVSRRAVDLLGLEALIRVGIAGHCNQLSDAAFAGVIALAVQNEVDGFCGL
jgi:hypothetical protein